MKTAVEVIREMLSLLNSPEKWTRYSAARNAKGQDTNVFSEDTMSWCLAGAFSRVVGNYSNMPMPGWVQEIMQFLEVRATKDTGRHVCIPTFNDDILTDYEDMRSYLKRALLEAEELNI